jgi:hypothetical protein
LGRMRCHSGSAGPLGVTLPIDGRIWRSGSKRGGSKRGGPERGGGTRETPCGNHPSSSRAASTASKALRRHNGSPGRGGGTRDTPCGNHPSSSRAPTMDSKARSMSFGFPVSAAVTNAFPAFNQWGRLKDPGGKSAITACRASSSVTIFRNGPLLGVMTNVKRVSQSAIVNARWTAPQQFTDCGTSSELPLWVGAAHRS